MAFDERLAERIDAALSDRDDVRERKMFGGIAFMLAGNMCCGVIGENLVLRLGAELADAALDEVHTHPMDFTGRPMRGFIYVDPAGIAEDRDLQRWLQRAVAFVQTLPEK